MYLNDYDVFLDVVDGYNDLVKRKHRSNYHHGSRDAMNLRRGQAWLSEAEVVTGELADVRRLHIPAHKAVSGYPESLLFEAFGTLRRECLPGNEFTLFDVAARASDGQEERVVEAWFQEFRHAEAFQQMREEAGDGSYAITASKRVLLAMTSSLAAWAPPANERGASAHPAKAAEVGRGAGKEERGYYNVCPMTVGEGCLNLKLPVGTFLREEDASVFEKAFAGPGLDRMLTITESARSSRGNRLTNYWQGR